MGQHRKGIALRRRTPGGVLYARFSLSGVQHERSTGARDHATAWPEAERIHAQEVLRAGERRRKPKRLGSGTGTPLGELLARWLVSLESTHAANTRKTWELYAFTHWEDFFRAAHGFTPASTAEYMRTRLRVVKAETVKHELSALRSFVAWATAEGELPDLVTVPSLPKRATGTPHSVKRRAPAVPLDPAHVEAFLAALPEWSSSRKVERFAVRARFVLAYETSLRPSTLDRIETPKHYRPGEGVLRLTPDTDKVRWDRDVPLSARARAALDAVLAGLPPDYAGPIFGAHDYRTHVERAALVLPAEVRDRFCGAHLRSAALTHWIDEGVPLTAAQWMAGQKRVSTTARYVKSSFRSAREALERRASGDETPSK